MIGVAVTVIVADGCYRAYKKRKVRKNLERQLGITPEDRREIRRLTRERERERRQREREWRRHLRARRDGNWDNVEVAAHADEFSELAGMGLPEYSQRPRDGVDRAVTAQGPEQLTMNGQKRKGIRKLFKRRQTEPEPIVEGEVQRLQKKKKGWFRRKKGRRADEQGRALMMEGPPPPYEIIAGEVGEDILDTSVTGTSGVPTRHNSESA